MWRTHSILVYVDAEGMDEVALDTSIEAARANDSHLEFVCVMPPGPRFPTPKLPGLRASATQQSAGSTTDPGAILDGIVDKIGGRYDAVSACVLRGEPAMEITRRVVARGHDLVIKAAKRNEAMGFFQGRLAAKLIRSCPCPVWVVQSNRTAVSRVAAVIDNEGDDGCGGWLNPGVIERAMTLAEFYGAEFNVVHAWDAFAVDLLAKRVRDQDLQRYLRDQEVAARKRVSEVLEKSSYSDESVRVSLPRGDAETVLPDFVKSNEIDLLVMGAVTRNGISGLLLGEPAAVVARRIDCSMLTVNSISMQRSATTSRLRSQLDSVSLP